MPKPLRPLTPELSPAHRLGAELRAYRRKSGHSQQSLGEAVHVSKALIGSIEAGERISSAEVIKACDDELVARGELCDLWRTAAKARRRPGRPSKSAAGARTPESSASSSLGWAMDYVERTLNVRLDRTGATRGSASVGAATNRRSWIRLERASIDDVGRRGWGGIEAVAALPGIAAPEWINSLTWRGEEPGVLWRADEVKCVEQVPVEAGASLARDPGLTSTWWKTWTESMDTLGAGRSTRIAVARRQSVTADHVARVIEAVWPRRINTRVLEWTCAHGEMTWRKLTGPECWILGWDGYGVAPRGLDAATLWSNSLGVPEVAARIWRERAADLESPTGELMALFCLARILGSPRAPRHPLYELANAEAAHLLAFTSLSA